MPKVKSENSPKRLLRHLSHMPVITLATIALSAAVGLGFALFSGNMESALALWAWGVAILFPYLSLKFIIRRRGNIFSRILGFAVVALSCAASKYGWINVGFALLFLAPITYFGTKKMFALCSVPVVIWTLIVPNAEYIHYFLSYPLRYATAEISAVILSVAGFAAEASDTMISIGGKQIAITSACSGIDQLEAMLLVAWVISVMMRRDTAVRIAHFAAVLPIIILMNCLRLTVTLAGYETYGNAFLSDGVHSGLGIAMVFLTAIVFMSAGKLFPKDAKDGGEATK